MLSYAILNHSDAADFWEHPSEIMVFTCFYSEQSRPHNIKHPHMGTLRKGFNGGFFFDVFFGGVRVSSKVSIQYWGGGYILLAVGELKY